MVLTVVCIIVSTTTLSIDAVLGPFRNPSLIFNQPNSIGY